MTKDPLKVDRLPSIADIRALEEQTRTWKELAAKAVEFSDRVLQLIGEHERLKEQLESARRVRGWRDVVDRIREDDVELAAVLERASVRSYSPDEVKLEVEVGDDAVIKLNAKRISSFALQVLGVKTKVKVFRIKK